MDNDFVDQKIVKARKDCVCSLCGDVIKRGQSKWSVAESVDGKINKLDCHMECFNVATELCDSCKKDGCDMSCVDCFKEGAKVIKLEEVMDAIKFVFDNINSIVKVELDGYLSRFYNASNLLIAEIMLDKIFGVNSVFPEKQTVYRDWYKENDNG
jgi:hypothetical protein